MITNSGPAAAMLTVNQSGNFGGSLQSGNQPVNLTMNGSGLLQLSGTSNVHTTNIYAGTLQVSGSLSVELLNVNNNGSGQLTGTGVVQLTGGDGATSPAARRIRSAARLAESAPSKSIAAA